MKLLLDITPSTEDIDTFWKEHPDLRALDHAAKLPPYVACIVREMNAAVEYDDIAYVIEATLLDNES